MLTYILDPEQCGPRALWPGRHANYLLPAMDDPWHPCGAWLQLEIRTMAERAGRSPKWLRAAVKKAEETHKRPAGRGELSELDSELAIILLDALVGIALKDGKSIDYATARQPAEAIAVTLRAAA